MPTSQSGVSMQINPTKFHAAPGLWALWEGSGPERRQKGGSSWSKGSAGSQGKEGPFLHESSCIRPLVNTSSSQGEKSEPIKQPLKKSKLPQGRFDAPEDDTHLEKEPLTKFPDDVNPVTKERGGPRGPEPTRYGDWERKGRCIDF
ncbi:hypothetical protein MDA_GLEAN10018120 [Myotis davidii]|uniref:Succinate dehydrogenase assembly factor 4, mitochondrial n=1 Tax=Myotis davidii TaxID=225400 RepID=L5LH64_MYODS|nr:hypothetical protein MDA_GLEAN10018120 [Myotis davidii]